MWCLHVLREISKPYEPGPSEMHCVNVLAPLGDLKETFNSPTGVGYNLTSSLKEIFTRYVIIEIKLEKTGGRLK